MPRPVRKPIEDLNEIERVLFGLSGQAVEALGTLLRVPDRERSFFRYRYVDRDDRRIIADRLISYEKDMKRLRRRVLGACKEQIFS